jgi:hypothetical protein
MPIVLVTALGATAPGTAAYGASGHVLFHQERERSGTVGDNDSPATAERIKKFGTGRHEQPTVRIVGSLSAAGPDVDLYSVDLEVGDVVGAAARGSVNEGLAVLDPDGRVAVVSRGNQTFFYPAASPLPRGETGKPVLHYIATRAGRYTISAGTGAGTYEITVRAFRPGPEQNERGTVQTLFLDFSGPQVDTTNFQLVAHAEPGIRDLSPFAAFLPRWGLSPDDEDAVVEVITETVRELLVRDVVARGANPNAELRVVSNADGPDPYGHPNVSRVVVGGTQAEAVFGFTTVGVAESTDPGNFAQEETALILLDLLSGPAEDPDAPLGGRLSLNHYLTDSSDRIQFIGRVLGQTAAHEAGHFYGNFHTDGLNDVVSLMDASRQDPVVLFGVGPDGIGGTADDIASPRLGPDAFDPSEAFTGSVEDTLNVVAFAISRGMRRPQSPPRPVPGGGRW